MKPLNTKHRRTAFLKFLLLFLITVSAIVGAVFFTFKIPTVENDLLKQQAERIKLELEFQDTFTDKMKSTKKMLDSLEVPGVNLQYLNQLIGKDLSEMQKSIPRKDSTYRYDMYSQVVNLYVELQGMQTRLRSLKGSESTIEEYKLALEKSNAEFKQLERDLLLARSR